MDIHTGGSEVGYRSVGRRRVGGGGGADEDVLAAVGVGGELPGPARLLAGLLLGVDKVRELGLPPGPRLGLGREEGKKVEEGVLSLRSDDLPQRGGGGGVVLSVFVVNFLLQVRDQDLHVEPKKCKVVQNSVLVKWLH